MTEQWNILSPKQAEAFDILENNTEVTTLLYAGQSGAGKSGLICCWQAYRRIYYPGTVGCIARRFISSIYKTTLESFHEFWNLYFVNNPYDVTYKVDNKNNIIKFSNGSRVYLVDLELKPADKEYVRLGSLNLTDLCVDEVTECNELGCNIISSRVRYLLEDTKAKIPKILLTGNPASNWVKSKFVSDKEGNPVKLKSHQYFLPASLNDNPNKSFVKTYRQSLLDNTDPYTQARLLLGDWDARQPNEDPFFFRWNREEHVSSVDFEPSDDEQLYFSFDFNNNPCTALVFFIRNAAIYYYETFQVEGGTAALCEAINERYGDRYYIKVTGDASGFQKRSSSLFTDWNIVKSSLNLTSRQMVLRRANLTHIESRSISNYMLYKNRVQVHPTKCYDLIQEIERAKTKRDGTGLYKSTQRGVGFDMDLVDCFRYSTNIIAPNGKSDLEGLEDTRLLNFAQLGDDPQIIKELDEAKKTKNEAWEREIAKLRPIDDNYRRSLQSMNKSKNSSVSASSFFSSLRNAK